MSRQEVQSVIDTAFREAIFRRHEYLTIEHLLYSIVQFESGNDIISNCGGDVNILLKELIQFFSDKIPELPIHIDSEVNNEIKQKTDQISPVQTIGFQHVLERTMSQVASSGKSEIDVGDLLVSIFSEQDSYAAYMLKKQGLTKLKLLDYISHSSSETDKESESSDSEQYDETDQFDEQPAPSRKKVKSLSRIESYALNLTALAKLGKLDPLIGREHETERIIQVLCRRLKHNPILIGEPGVGKTAIVEGLAQKIVKNEVPQILQNTEIFTLDLGSLLAGTKFRGQFEQRLKTIFKVINEYNNKSKSGPGAILFIDEIHMIVGAGSTTGASIDVSGILKKAIHTDDLRCIGTTTHEEFRRHFENDRALVRRFQKIIISETTIDDTIDILKGLRSHFEDYYKIKYTDPALDAATHLSFKHINEQFLPDKAIDIIDEAGAMNHISAPENKKEIIDVEDIENVVSKILNIPDLNPDQNERDQLAHLETKMKSKVFSQDSAIEAVVSVIKLSRAGLNLPDHPVGSFLFAGPTGVGKTEVAKQLALTSGVPFKRFDMSEYMEKHAVSRLIGAPPGYVGYEQGGLLTEAIRKNPHSVLLLDEIEKAHIDLFDILLQVMDHATLTDNTGREADFRNVTLIMTTNAGAREMNQRSIGFDQSKRLTANKNAIDKLFSPEFRNRLTEIIFFDALSAQTMQKIVDKFITELNIQLTSQDIHLNINTAVRKWLAENGYNEMYGARPLNRLIQDTIRRPLADEILFGKLKEGGTVKATLKNKKIVFSFVYHNFKFL